MENNKVNCLYEIYLENRKNEKAKREKESQKSGEFKRILIIEDQVSDILPLKAILEEMGDYVIEMGFDGQAAVESLVGKSYDLIILDWMMPDFKGSEALEYAQKLIDEGGDKSDVAIPFIAYSGLHEEKLNIPETRNFNYVGHWKKPMTVIELTKKVNEYFAA